MENYQQTLDKLFAMLPMFQREGSSAYKADLSNITALLQAMGNPHEHFKSIHIAGTNGKGSTAHFISSLLQENGLKVGLHTSPHYLDFRERIKINGHLIEKDVVVEIFEENSVLIERLRPSFFEFTVAMAFEVFRREKVDVAVIETGLGGRLDSTNIIKPLISIITNIGHDHQNILGNTPEAIAAEKAGIIKENTPVVIGEKQKKPLTVFKKIAAVHNASLYLAEELIPILDFQDRMDGMSLDIRFSEYNCHIETPFAGAYQHYNIRTALAAYKVLAERGELAELSTDCATISAAFANVRQNTSFMGRWQVLHKQPLVIVDSAHNREGLTQSLRQILDYEREVLHIVLGFVSDKEWPLLLKQLPKGAEYYCVSPNVPRGLNVEELQRRMVLEGFKARKFDTVRSGISQAFANASSYDLIYVVGSTFVAAEALEWRAED